MNQQGKTVTLWPALNIRSLRADNTPSICPYVYIHNVQRNGHPNDNFVGIERIIYD